MRAQVPDADPEDVLLFDDLLGIADPTLRAVIDPDARRRRLTALVNAASLARETPAVYVVEDVHWIDEVSESMLADFLAVIPHTPSLVLITYRPEYEGALTRVGGAQTIALAPLTDSQTSALVRAAGRPLGCRFGRQIANSAAGNPFFAEEIVRDLAERGVLAGSRAHTSGRGRGGQCAGHLAGHHRCAHRPARPAAKRTLSAAAVIGSRFDPDLLTVLGDRAGRRDLLAAEFVDQVRFTREPSTCSATR